MGSGKVSGMSKHIVSLDFDVLRDVFKFESEPTLIGFGGESLVFSESGDVVKCYYATPNCDLAERHQMIANEIAVLHQLEDASSTTLQVPRLRDIRITPYGAGQGPYAILPGQEADTLLLGYIRTTQLPGEQFLLSGMPTADLPAAVAQYGAATAEMHRMLDQAYAYEDPPECMPLHPDVIASVIADPYLAAHAPALQAAASALRETPYVPVHGDCHTGNFLAHEGRISGVVDWSCTSMAPAALDAYKLFSNWSEHDGRAGLYLPHYLKAYNAHADTKLVISDIFNTGILYTAGHLAQVSARDLPEVRQFFDNEMAVIKNWAASYSL